MTELTPAEPGKLAAAWLSRKGRRPSNEDAAEAVCFERGSMVRGYAIVCDGMGGHNAGEVASAAALNALRARLEEIRSRRELTEAGAGPGLSDAVQEWVSAVNSEILRQGHSRPELSGMGTTMAMAAVLGESRLLVANVGDSKVFLVRGVMVEQLSVDHTALAEQRKALGQNAGPIGESRNPFAHALTRSVGQEERVQVDTTVRDDLREGDLVIVTSDGVTDVLESERFLLAVEQSRTLEEIAEVVYQLAFEGGSKDNISVALLARGKPSRLGVAPRRAPSQEPTGEKRLPSRAEIRKPESPARPAWLPWAGVAGALILVVAGILGVLGRGGKGKPEQGPLVRSTPAPTIAPAPTLATPPPVQLPAPQESATPPPTPQVVRPIPEATPPRPSDRTPSPQKTRPPAPAEGLLLPLDLATHTPIAAPIATPTAVAPAASSSVPTKPSDPSAKLPVKRNRVRAESQYYFFDFDFDFPVPARTGKVRAEDIRLGDGTELLRKSGGYNLMFVSAAGTRLTLRLLKLQTDFKGTDQTPSLKKGDKLFITFPPDALGEGVGRTKVEAEFE